MTEEPAKKGIGKKTIILVALVVIIASFCAYTFYDLNGRSFSLSDRQMLLIVTDSMDGNVTEYEIDSFPADTFVMIKHLSEEEKLNIKVGDVLSFWYGGILDHHRVKEIHFDHGYVITHGDNTHADEKVNLSDINGQVIGANHWLGALVSFVKANFLIVIAAIAIIAIAGEIYRAYRNGVFSKEE